MSEQHGETTRVFVVLVLSIGVLPPLMWRPRVGYMHGMVGMMEYGWGFMLLIPLAFLVLIALGAHYLLSELTRTGATKPRRGQSALEALKERYAKGEVTREEYVMMKEELAS